MSAAKKPRMGRPPVAKRLEKRALLSVRFTEGERATLERAAKREDAKLSEWARRALLRAAEPVDKQDGA